MALSRSPGGTGAPTSDWRIGLRPLALATTIGMFVVLVMGATVTNTGSATGCGHSWPLCRGQLIPAFAVSTLIEFSHRAVTGVESVLVIALAAGVWMAYRRSTELRLLAGLMVVFLFVQAGMGAWAVMDPQTPGVIATHFGISLVAFASVLLVCTLVYEDAEGRERRQRAVPEGFARLTWGSLLFLLVVVYLGAYVRHAGLNLACRGWPLCNGAVVPTLDADTAIVFLHRLAALLATLLMGTLAVWSQRFRERRPDIAHGSLIAFGLILAQALSGALVVATGMDLFSALLHAALMALLFGGVSYVAFQVRAVGPVVEVGPIDSARRSVGAAPG